MLFRDILAIETKPGAYQDVTERVAAAIEKSGAQEGLCHVFLTGTTAGLLLNEYDRMLMEDFRRQFELIDGKKPYAHPANAFSHLRANLLAASLTLPVANGKLILGTWQRVILWEFDTEPRKRDLIVTVTGQG